MLPEERRRCARARARVGVLLVCVCVCERERERERERVRERERERESPDLYGVVMMVRREREGGRLPRRGRVRDRVRD